MIVTWEATRRQSTRPYYYDVRLGGFVCTALLSSDNGVPEEAITWIEVDWLVRHDRWVHRSNVAQAHKMVSDATLDLQTTWMAIVPQPSAPKRKDDWEQLSDLIEDAKKDVLNTRVGRAAGSVVAWLSRRLSKTAG